MKRLSRIKKEGLIIFLCLVQSIIFAQYQIYVLDNEPKQAVEYAEIYFPYMKTSTITNTDGSFLIDTKSPSVLVQISCTGYKTFLGTISLGTNQKLYLIPSLHDLQEVVISANS